MNLYPLRRRWYASRLGGGPLGDFYRTPFPTPSDDLASIELVALDLETTGLDPQRDNILSAGWVKLTMQGAQLASAEHHLVRQVQALNESSVVIHTITDDAAARGDELCLVLERILSVLRGRVLLAHNARIENRFLNLACRHCFNGPFFMPTIDTLQLALRRKRQRDELTRSGELRLASLREQYNLPRYRAHNALSDALATAELFLAQLAHWSGGRSVSLKQLLG